MRLENRDMSHHENIGQNKVLKTVAFLLMVFLFISAAGGSQAEVKDKVNNLIQKLQSKHAHTRAMAVKELGKIKDTRVVVPLINALKDTDSYVRGQAAWELGEIRDAQAVPQLISVLGNDDFVYVRFEAARALGKIKDVRSVQPLINALKDEARDIREEAAEALIEIGNPATDQMLQALKEKNVRAVANGYYFFICTGEPDSEPMLIESLDKFGTKNMALDFVQCGNIHLKEAAYKWAESHRYKIEEHMEAGSSPKWGRCRSLSSTVK